MSKTQYTKELRQQIIEEFMRSHGIDEVKPQDFLDEASDKDHPAHDYFEWDDSVASFNYRLWQARRFLQVEVNVVDRPQELPLAVEVQAPLMVSPGDGETSYVPTASTLGQATLREQAETEIYSWFKRYQSVLAQDEIEAFTTFVDLLETRERQAI